MVNNLLKINIVFYSDVCADLYTCYYHPSWTIEDFTKDFRHNVSLYKFPAAREIKVVVEGVILHPHETCECFISFPKVQLILV
jgi:hypothetical protein